MVDKIGFYTLEIYVDKGKLWVTFTLCSCEPFELRFNQASVLDMRPGFMCQIFYLATMGFVYWTRKLE